MPSENEMAIRFSVPRTEIRRAYERLKELGYIYSVRGCGSFYAGKTERIRLVLTDTSSFSEKMKKLNVDYRTVNLGAVKLEKEDVYKRQLSIISEWISIIPGITNRPEASITSSASLSSAVFIFRILPSPIRTDPP